MAGSDCATCGGHHPRGECVEPGSAVRGVGAAQRREVDDIVDMVRGLVAAEKKGGVATVDVFYRPSGGRARVVVRKGGAKLFGFDVTRPVGRAVERRLMLDFPELLDFPF